VRGRPITYGDLLEVLAFGLAIIAILRILVEVL
jgi:hypothetical protein